MLKNLTWRDRLTFFSLVSPTVNSSKKSRRVSTSKEKNFVTYWNEFSQEMFQWLWSVIKIDSPVSALNLSNGSAKDKVVNSWFSSKVTLSPEREMVEDILAIIHVFSCRLYGLRKYKKLIREDLHPVSNGTEPRTTPSSKKVGQTESESI